MKETKLKSKKSQEIFNMTERLVLRVDGWPLRNGMLCLWT